MSTMSISSEPPRPTCAKGTYLDRGPAFPIGSRAKCSWCRTPCWNRGCSECPANFHKTCYYAHLSRARDAALPQQNYTIPPQILEERELRPFLKAIGLPEYFGLLTSNGIHGHSDLVRFNDSALSEIGMKKVVHRRKLLRQVAQIQAARLGGGAQPVEEEPCVVLELNVQRKTPETKLGLALSEKDGCITVTEVMTASVSANSGFEPGMVVLRIDGKSVTSQEEFMQAVHGKTSFCITVRPTGEVPPTEFERLFPTARNDKLGREDFEKLRMLGTGTFSEVYLVRQKITGKLYALKVLDKRSLVDKMMSRDAVMRERDMMKHAQWADDRFLVRLHHTFQSPSQLFFVLDYCPGGDLYEYLGTKPGGRLTEEVAKFYGAQIFFALRALHKHGVVYRDLKPENILLDERGNAKLADFGLSRPLAWGDRATTFVGTPEYMAPEMVQGKPYSYAVDWWAYGVVLFNCLTGEHAFGQGSECADTIWRSVTHDTPKFAKCYNISPECQGLVLALLEKDPDLRLEGEVIRKQPWWSDIDMAAIERGDLEPPSWAAPMAMVTQDNSHDFPGYGVGSPGGPGLNEEQQELFQGFSYNDARFAGP
eukprot:Sspe_Gene.66952::Locus_39541_Transcript_1_1_Confidence_1.000_Length_2004::g.66952::m.66952/K04373/RPS6KA; ribosomal protein S6 kinase alpha-1/2/3/6